MMALKKLNKKAKVGIICSIVFTFILLSSFILIKAGDELSGSTETSEVIGDKEKLYDNSTETITIKKDDTKEELVKIQLDSPRENQVGLGYQLVAEKSVYPEIDIDSFIKSFVIKDLKNNGQIVSKQIDVKYKSWYDEEVINYIEECKEEFDEKNGTIVNNCVLKENGTRFERKYTWETFNNNLKSKENITIGLFTDVQQGDYYDWVPTYTIDKTDISVEEWATWSGNISTNIVRYFKLDEQSGAVIDSSGYGNATNYGAINTSGKIKYGYEFKGSETINISDIDLPDTFTLNAWIKTKSIIPSQATIIQKHGTSGVVPYSLDFDNSIPRKLRFVVNNGTGYFSVESTNGLSTETWHMVSGVYNSTHIIIYIDGIYNTSKPHISTPIDNNYLTKIGSRNNDLYFNGTIDEVAIWNRSLSATEIALLYNSGDGCAYGNESCYSPPNTAPTITTTHPTTNQNLTSQSVTFSILPKDGEDATGLWTAIYLNISGGWVMNATNTSAFNNTQTNITSVLPDGTYKWAGWVNDSSGSSAFSSNNTFFIDSTKPTITSPSNATITYLQGLSVDFDASDSGSGVNTSSWEVNDTTRFQINTTGGLTNKTILPAGTWIVNVSVKDNLGNQNYSMWQVAVNKYTTALSISGTTPIIYGTTSDFSGSGCPSGLTCSFNQPNAVYGAGTTTFNYSTAGNENYTANWTIKEMTITKATLTGTLYSSSGAWNIEIGSSTNISYHEGNIGDGDVTYTLYNNSFVFSNNTEFNEVVGTYQIILNSTGGANYSSSSNIDSETLTFADTTPPSVSILYPVNAFIYTGANAPTQFNYSATDPALAFCWYSINQGLSNSTPYSTCPNITEIPTSYGNNTWRIYANDTSGNFNYSEVSFTLAEPVIGYGQYGGSASYDLTMPTASIISNETINNEEKNPETFAQLIDKWSKNRNFVIFVVLLTLMFLASYGKSRRRK